MLITGQTERRRQLVKGPLARGGLRRRLWPKGAFSLSLPLPLAASEAVKVEDALFTGDKGRAGTLAKLTAQLANLFALSKALDHNVPPLICPYVLRDKRVSI